MCVDINSGHSKSILRGDLGYELPGGGEMAAFDWRTKTAPKQIFTIKKRYPQIRYNVDELSNSAFICNVFVHFFFFLIVRLACQIQR